MAMKQIVTYKKNQNQYQTQIAFTHLESGPSTNCFCQTFLSCLFSKFWNTIDDDVIYGWPCMVNILTQMEIQIAMSLSMQPHGSNNSATSFRSNDVGWAKACPILIWFDFIWFYFYLTCKIVSNYVKFILIWRIFSLVMNR